MMLGYMEKKARLRIYWRQWLMTIWTILLREVVLVEQMKT
jgi:hypothetical protein